MVFGVKNTFHVVIAYTRTSNNNNCVRSRKEEKKNVKPSVFKIIIIYSRAAEWVWFLCSDRGMALVLQNYGNY